MDLIISVVIGIVVGFFVFKVLSTKNKEERERWLLDGSWITAVIILISSVLIASYTLEPKNPTPTEEPKATIDVSTTIVPTAFPHSDDNIVATMTPTPYPTATPQPYPSKDPGQRPNASIGGGYTDPQEPDGHVAYRIESTPAPTATWAPPD